MADCEKITKCVFFNDKMAHKPATAEIMKNNYCRSDKNQCARYQVALSGKPVPPDLYPSQANRVIEIVSAS
jgi:hypothetical protein